MDALSGQVGSFRAATSLPHGAPAGRPRWRGNAKRLARGWTLEAIVARRRCPVVVLLTFFAALAGLVVRAYVARRQDHQYVLVNGISVDLSRRCADRTGLGCRAWARRSPVMHHGAIDVVAVCDAVARQPSRSPGPPSLGEPGELVGLRSRNIPVIPTAGLAGLAGFIPLIQMLSDRFGFVPEPTGIDLNMSQWSVPGELSETGRSCDSLGMNAHVIPPRPGRWVTSDLKAGWYDQLPGPALRGPAGTWPSAPRATHSRT